MLFFNKNSLNSPINRYLFFCIYFLLRLYRKIFPINERQVWIIGENNGHCLKENGYHFYKYCRKKKADLKVYFVNSRDCIFYDQLTSKDPHVLTYGSLRHAFIYLASTHCFYTHFYRDIIYRRIFQVDHAAKRIIYLHHGVLGFKRFDNLYMKNKNIMHLFTVGNEMERSILTQQIGVDESIVKCTGYARYDALVDNSAGKKQIAYIPTFRNFFLDNDNAFKNSTFLKQINSFLSNNNLIRMLEQQKISLKVYLHEEFQRFSSQLQPKSNSMIVCRKNENTVKELICESNLLITDYSSVAWDFFYLGKPVLLYRFDAEEYLKSRGSYIDLYKNIIGPVFTEEDELIESVQREINDDFQIALNSESSLFAVPRLDRQNCQRIFSEALAVSRIKSI